MPRQVLSPGLRTACGELHSSHCLLYKEALAEWPLFCFHAILLSAHCPLQVCCLFWTER